MRSHTQAVRHEFSQALRNRDEPIRQLQQRLVQEAQKYRLPYEGQAAAATGAASGSSADGLAAEVARLSQQVTDTKESHRVLAEALAEKAEVAARIRAAQMQLEGAAASRAGSTDGAREEAAVQTDASEEGKCPPGYGRRAPPMPTRQGTMEAAVNGRLSPMAANKPMQLQTDYLCQVTPMASYSPGSEGVSPGAVQMRAGSAGCVAVPRLCSRLTRVHGVFVGGWDGGWAAPPVSFAWWCSKLAAHHPRQRQPLAPLKSPHSPPPLLLVPAPHVHRSFADRSGRRRSRLSEKQEDGYTAEGET